MDVAFFLMSAGLLFTPGPTNTLLAMGGATSGLRRSWLLPPAELAGYFLAIHLLAFAVGPLVQAPSVQLLSRLGLALYLIWLAAQLWRSHAALLPHQTVTPARVFTVTLLNPKALVFAFVVLPPLAQGWSAALPSLAALAAMIVSASLCWIALGAAIARGRIMDTGWITRAGGGVLALFAILLALSALR
jgi:threonine/homoserine/homoserine lactone efflux protein